MCATFINLVAGPDLLILLVIVLFVFGAKVIPGIPRTIRAMLAAFQMGKNGELPKTDAPQSKGIPVGRDR